MAFDSRCRLAEIKCQTLVVAASNDETVRLHHAKMPPATNRRNPATPSTVQSVRRSQLKQYTPGFTYSAFVMEGTPWY